MTNIIKEKIYRISISVLFGIIGFFVNFNTIMFPFGDYTVAILMGLLFPLLISISWGWKYGLLSALSGGTQTMWWLWGPSNGYAVFLIVPPFTLWIVWHGYLAGRRKRGKYRWWFNIYLWEIPFRFLNTLNLLTITRWAVQQNPPHWKWASNATNTVSFEFSSFVAIKQAIIAYILLLSADVLLNLAPVRQFFRLKPRSYQKHTGYIISFTLLLGFSYWFLDSVLYTYLAKDNLTFIDYLARNIPRTNLTTRVVFIICSLTAGLITSHLLRRQKTDEIALQKVQKEATNREALLSSLISAIPDLVWLKDENGVYLACNSRFEDFFGAKERDIIGKTDYDFVGKELADFFRMHDKNVMIKCSACTNEEEITFANDGHCELLETTKTPMYNKNGELIGILGIGRDITERKKTQEMLIQSEKILSVGGLAAGMAHEINNPLAGMVQNAYVMKSRLAGVNIPANQQAAAALGIRMEDITAFLEKRNIFRMLDAIQESGARAAEIVNSMLNFARKSDTSFSSHYPDQLMDTILDLAATDYDLKKQYDFKSIEIVKEYADNLPMLACEGAKIQQVMLNILKNGAQALHMAKTKSPRLTLRVYSKGAPEMIHIEIEDNGPGMDEQTRSKVFDPFFTTKPVGIGTGLGLSVSYFIITENHNGTIDVISEPGKGTNFIIRLPVNG